ncbi:outer membrane usher protein [Kluyvera sp. CRP]|uniref:outer membrane usher protein n=1 Tax=Kluyvera sp. CRP TaxID=2873269 RepID=UPI001CC1D7AC|nr:outer membrane usher protein [Kluyvera sp. CRP]UAK22637.1 outer membrane usher protein [Kluyvera sp. CRP]
MQTSPGFRLRACTALSMAILITGAVSARAEDIHFNMDALDVDDRSNIDLTRFSRSGYIVPGLYSMVVNVNRASLPETSVEFYAPADDPKGSVPCLTPGLVSQLGLKDSIIPSLRYVNNGRCLDMQSLPGTQARGDISTGSLYLSIPQAFMEYTAENWDPPSRWDNGIPGILFDYSLNSQAQRDARRGDISYSLSGNGTAGANVGAWRLRADWQSQLDRFSGSGRTQKSMKWSRYYAYRPVPSLGAKLTAGEGYLDSAIFDSFRFTGAGLVSDDNMLPPNLRGYAPEVVGVAKTNAKVIITQMGRVLYETTVAAGPFRIQDINDSVSGTLNVRVEEQDGSVHEFTMNTASIPYLTRPGSFRYKLATGKPSDWQHRSRGPLFGAGEFSWGVSNGWSLYGGALAGGDYSALSFGIGRDLLALGALSFDATQSRARLPQEDNTLSGGSYRLNYSKSFDEYDSQITFAGYRFSERTFMSMSEYLDAGYYGIRTGKGKEKYSIIFNKHFRDLGVSAYLNYTHETYWDRPAGDLYNLSLSRYFDIGPLRNLSLSLSAYRNQYNGLRDDGGYLSLSVPWGADATVSYNVTLNRDAVTHRASYNRRVDEHSHYQLSAGRSPSGTSLSGYYSLEGDMARMSANASYQEGRYSAVGASASGGVTLTAEGGAVHRDGVAGGTRILIDSDGVPGVPVRGFGSTTRTNVWGKAVTGEVSSYYRNQVSIDLNGLADNAEVSQSVVQATLTEGAIGYRKFQVIAGQKAMAVIKLANGSEPPFGASVMNGRKRETGIVNDGGNVYLSGINAGEAMTVHWDGKAQCEVRMPATLPEEMLANTLLLPCHARNDKTADKESDVTQLPDRGNAVIGVK